MAARLAEEIHAKKDEQQEVRDLQKYFNQSVPELRSKFAGNLLQAGLPYFLIPHSQLASADIPSRQ